MWEKVEYINKGRYSRYGNKDVEACYVSLNKGSKGSKRCRTRVAISCGLKKRLGWLPGEKVDIYFDYSAALFKIERMPKGQYTFGGEGKKADQKKYGLNTSFTANSKMVEVIGDTPGRRKFIIQDNAIVVSLKEFED